MAARPFTAGRQLRRVSVGGASTAEGEAAEAECGGDWPFHEAGQGEGTGGEGNGGGAYLSMSGDVDVWVLARVEELHDGHEVRLCDGDAASGRGAVGDVQEES